MNASVPLKVLVTGATGFLGQRTLAALGRLPGVQPIAACRTPSRLQGHDGEVRAGDLLDAAYRRAVVRGVDVVCHAGTWGSFWGHARLEDTHFHQPALDLLEQSIAAGVRRFVQPSTVAIAAVARDGQPLDDFAPTRPTGFWPHLDRLIDLDRHMQRASGRGMQMVTLRLGHFVGAGNRLGMVPALVPRLRTRLVPWLAGGRARLALVGGDDLGRGCALACAAPGLRAYESFNMCGPGFPSAREVITFIAAEAGVPRPRFSVPYAAGYAFGWLMEALHPVLPGTSPFLTRSLVHVSEDWYCSGEHARRALGYEPREDWRDAVRAALAELRREGYPWPLLAQQA